MAKRFPPQDDDSKKPFRKARTLEEAIIRTQGPSRTVRPSLAGRSRTPMPLPMPRPRARPPLDPGFAVGQAPPAQRLPWPGAGAGVPGLRPLPAVRPGAPGPGPVRLPATPSLGPGAPVAMPLPMPAPALPSLEQLPAPPPRGNVPTTGVSWDFLDAHPVLRDLLQSLQGAAPQAPQMEMPTAISQILGQVQQPQFSPGASDQAWMDWGAERDEEDEQAAAQQQLASALQALGLV